MLLMIVLSFLSAVVCYREYLHIGVGMLPAVLREPAKTYLGWLLELCMLATNLFMLVWGIKLVQADLASDHSGIPDRLGRTCPTCRSRSAARSPSCSLSSGS